MECRQRIGAPSADPETPSGPRLAKAISCDGNAEKRCHGFMTGLFSATDLHVTSNRENGDGRPDIIMTDSSERSFVFELKHADSEARLAQKPGLAWPSLWKTLSGRPLLRAGDDCLRHLLQEEALRRQAARLDWHQQADGRKAEGRSS